MGNTYSVVLVRVVSTVKITVAVATTVLVCVDCRVFKVYSVAALIPKHKHAVA